MKVIQPRRFNPWKSLLVLAVLAAVTVFTTRREAGRIENPAWTGETMGTTFSIKLAGVTLTLGRLAEIEAAVRKRLAEVNAEMSHYDPDSELSRFNRSPADTPAALSPAFARVIRFALELNRRSDGAFDPALGPLIDLWGFGPAGRTNAAPDEAAIRAALRRTGCRHLRLSDDGRLSKDIPDLRLNLSAVAKGYGVDEAARVIRDFGVSNVFVEIGGEVTAFGRNARGAAWRVGVERPNPDALPGEDVAAVLELSDAAVATSGDYRNFFVDADGRRYTHILDPRTGYPIDHRLASVSVVAGDCMTADGLATTLFVMGPDEGLRFIRTWPGVEALFLVRDDDGTFREIASPGFEKATGYRP